MGKRKKEKKSTQIDTEQAEKERIKQGGKSKQLQKKKKNSKEEKIGKEKTKRTKRRKRIGRKKSKRERCLLSLFIITINDKNITNSTPTK